MEPNKLNNRTKPHSWSEAFIPRRRRRKAPAPSSSVRESRPTDRSLLPSQRSRYDLPQLPPVVAKGNQTGSSRSLSTSEEVAPQTKTASRRRLQKPAPTNKPCAECGQTAGKIKGPLTSHICRTCNTFVSLSTPTALKCPPFPSPSSPLPPTSPPLVNPQPLPSHICPSCFPLPTDVPCTEVFLPLCPSCSHIPHSTLLDIIAHEGDIDSLVHYSPQYLTHPRSSRTRHHTASHRPLISKALRDYCFFIASTGREILYPDDLTSSSSSSNTTFFIKHNNNTPKTPTLARRITSHNPHFLIHHKPLHHDPPRDSPPKTTSAPPHPNTREAREDGSSAWPLHEYTNDDTQPRRRYSFEGDDASRAVEWELMGWGRAEVGGEKEDAGYEVQGSEAVEEEKKGMVCTTFEEMGL